MLYKQTVNPVFLTKLAYPGITKIRYGGRRRSPKMASASLRRLANAAESLITRASVDPGRELNGRSQQFHLSGDFDATGPIGPSSRASAF
jgi:hypothetical protein